MKKWIRDSFMLSAIVIFVVFQISFLCFDYKEEMGFVNQLFLLSFFICLVQKVVPQIPFRYFVLEIIVEYLVIEVALLALGSYNHWFTKANWWMSFVYLTPIYMIAYLIGLSHIKKEVLFINKKLESKRRDMDNENEVYGQ